LCFVHYKFYTLEFLPLVFNFSLHYDMKDITRRLRFLCLAPLRLTTKVAQKKVAETANALIDIADAIDIERYR